MGAPATETSSVTGVAPDTGYRPGRGEIAAFHRQESPLRGKTEALTRAAADTRTERADHWPLDAREGRGVFARPHGLRHEGRTYRLEIRSSRRGAGCWIMINGGLVVHGATEPIALANAIKAIDSDVEFVRDEAGRRLA